MKPLLSLCLCLLLTNISGVRAEETAPEGRVAIEWTGQQPGSDAQPPQEEAFLHTRRDGKALIAGPESTPPSPFPAEVPVLAVQTGTAETGEENVALSGNPFYGTTPPAKGWIELEAAVESHFLVVTIRANAASDKPLLNRGGDPGSRGNVLCSVFLRGKGQPIIVLEKNPDTGQTTRTPLSGNLVPGVAHRFRIAWDWEVAEPGLRFFLDGAPLTLKNEGELFPVKADTIGRGINSIDVSLTGRGSFLGRIRASE